MAESTQSTVNSVAAVQAAQERCRELEATLQRYEAALRASEARYQIFVDHTADALFLHDSDGRVVDANRQAHESLGYDREELIGMVPADFDPDVTPAVRKERVARLETGETIAFDTRHRRKDGSVFPVEVRICPFWADGKRQLLALARDITERRQAEDMLRESEERFRAVVECCAQAVWETGPNGELISDSPSWRAYTGQSADQWWNDRWVEAVHPEDREYAHKQWRESIQNVAQVNAAFRIRHGDNGWRWTNVRAAPLLAPDGSVRKWVGMNINITERKEAEQALRESQRFIERIATASPHIMYVFDRLRKQLVYRNRPTAVDLGYTAEEIAARGGDLFVQLLHPDDLRRRDALLERWDTAQDDEILESEYRLRDRDGKWHWFLARDTVFTRTPDGQVEQIIGTAQDITDWKQAEDELAVRQAELLHASRLTTVGRMVAALSHEVAQPLSAIGNFAAAGSQILDTVMRGSPDATQEPTASYGDLCANDQWETLREYIQAIAKQNQRCGAILERLRDFSQRTSARQSSCDIDHLLHDSVELVSNELRRHDVEVRFDLAKDLPPVVGDRVQLQQVVVNLLTNARDAVCDQTSRQRVITIHSRAEEEAVVFEVEDSGTGFSDEVAAHLFEPFYTTKESGMGIGLSICHSIVKDHHGQIDASSNRSGGATFRVRLPLSRKDENG